MVEQAAYPPWHADRAQTLRAGGPGASVARTRHRRFTHTLGKLVLAEHARFMRLLEMVTGIVRRRLDRDAAKRLPL
jgi:hypothetical protein